jgi:DNA-binding transcriptional regulator of glucitol operon
MNKLSMIFLILFPSVFATIGLLSGMWAIAALTIACILLLLSYLQFLKFEFGVRSVDQERSKWIFVGAGSAMFVVAAMFLVVIRPDEWMVLAFAIGFFGLCLLVAVRNHQNSFRL